MISNYLKLKFGVRNVELNTLCKEKTNMSLRERLENLTKDWTICNKETTALIINMIMTEVQQELQHQLTLFPFPLKTSMRSKHGSVPFATETYVKRDLEEWRNQLKADFELGEKL